VTDYVKLTRRAATLCACVAAIAAAPAGATPRFGVAEDATKYAEDGGVSFYTRMRSLRMVENRIAVRWNPAEPTDILERKFLDRAVSTAAQSGIRVVFDVFAIDPLAFGMDGETRATLFGAYLQKLARTYPQVTDYIVANEPNEAYFWRPQFGPSGVQASAAAFLRVLTRAYDALKAVNPEIRVIAAGLSGEGNDRTSTSPVRFLRGLGDAYRRSGRAAPVMDALGFHVYPQRNTHPPSRRYAWPNAGGADLARIKQAVWDAFAGTVQPTLPEGLARADTDALELVIGEFGWQVGIGPALAERYSGKENVPTITEAEQAQYYAELIGMLSCDPAVTDALLLHLVDDPDLGRFQTGLLRLDLSERPSYSAVRDAIADAPSCKRRAVWTHATGVAGAKAIFGARDHPAGKAIFGISVRAAEEARAKAGMFRVGGRDARPRADDVARSLSRATRDTDAVMTTRKLVKAGHKPRLEFRGQVAPGYYVYGVRLTATMNPDRSRTFVSKVFRVG
jgi:hypothetical protein